MKCILNLLQETHQSAEQLKQQFTQSRMQGQSAQGQVREHVIHQQAAPHQHATMNGYAAGQSGMGQQLSVDTSQRMLQAGVARSPSSAGRYY